MDHKGAKVTIVGAGTVGASVAYALATEGLATELALIDVDHRRSEGQAWDLSDAAAFIKPVNIFAADYPDIVGSAVVVFAAGVPRAPGQSRLDLARQNLDVLRQTFPRAFRYCPEAVYVIVTNPVDIVTFAAIRMVEVEESRIMGSGTVLDTSRFKSLLARHCRVDPRNIHAHVVGEHGDSEVALWSSATIAGVSVSDYCRSRGLPEPDQAQILSDVVKAGAAIIARKGATQFAPSIAVARIVEAVLRDERSVLTVSGMIEGVYGLEGPNCLSLPSVIDADGRHGPIPITLSPEELAALRASAARLKEIHREVGLA